MMLAGFIRQTCFSAVTLAPVCGLTSSEVKSLAGQRAAGVVDSHHPHLVGLVRLKFLQDTITLLHRDTVLLWHSCGQQKPQHTHFLYVGVQKLKNSLWGNDLFWATGEFKLSTNFHLFQDGTLIYRKYKVSETLKHCPPFSNVKTILKVFTSLWILHAVDLEAVYDVTRVDFPVNCDTGAGGWAWLLRLQRRPLRHWDTDEETYMIHNCCIHALKMRLLVWKIRLF